MEQFRLQLAINKGKISINKESLRRVGNFLLSVKIRVGENVIEINVEKKAFNEKILFENVDINLISGIYLLKGENGVGKSTLLNMIYDIDSDYTGEILINGVDVRDLEKSELRRDYVSYVRQNDDLFDFLTSLENIEMLASDYSMEGFEYLVKNLNLEKVINSRSKFKKFSGGEKQKIRILIGLLNPAPILLLDEPDNNLDIQSVEFLGQYLKETNKIVLVISHTFDEYIIGSHRSLEFEKLTIKEVHRREFEYDERRNEKLRIVNNPLDINKDIRRKLIRKNGRMRLYIYLTFFLFMFLSIYNSFVIYDSVEFLYGSGQKLGSDETLQVYAPVFSPLIYDFGDSSNLNRTPNFFKASDKKKLEELSEVSSVIPITKGSSMTASIYDLKESVNYGELDYQKYGMDNYRSGGMETTIVNFKCSNPYEVNTLGISSCMYEQKDLLYGDLPGDETDEVVLDYRLAILNADNMGLKNLEELLDKNVIISTQDESGVQVNKFKVRGILDPQKMEEVYGTEELTYITGYRKIENLERKPWLNLSEYDDMTPEEQAQILLMSGYDSIGKEIPSVSEVTPLKDNAYPGFYIRVKDSADVSTVVDLIKSYDPNIYRESNYTLKNSNNFEFMKFYYIKKIMLQMIIYLVLIILLYITIRMYNKELGKDQEKFEMLGFTDMQIRNVLRLDKKTLVEGLIICGFIISVVLGVFSGFHFGPLVVITINLIIFILMVIGFLFLKPKRRGK